MIGLQCGAEILMIQYGNMTDMTNRILKSTSRISTGQHCCTHVW